MPFAKVGIVPPTSNSSNNDSLYQSRKGRGGRQKGITMEDLKKQTAIRLAQEQHQAHGTTSSSVGVQEMCRTNVLPYGRQQKTTSMEANRYAVGHTRDSTNVQANRYLDRSGGSNPSSRNKPAREVVSAEVFDNMASVPSSSRYVVEKTNHYPSVAASQAVVAKQSAPIVSTGGFDTATAQVTVPVVTKTTKTKLPHGLTVHELKEMTKARLQAEAADTEKVRIATFDLRKERESSDLRKNVPVETSRHRYNPLRTRSEQLSAVPSTVQLHPRTSEQLQSNSRHPSHGASRPPGFHNFQPALPSYVDNLGIPDVGAVAARNPESYRHDPKLEAWETTSTTSHSSVVAPIHISSESALSSKVGRMVDDGHGVSRSRSFPTGNGLAGAIEMPPNQNATIPNASPSKFYFETPVGHANRQRALTLSPRPVLSLLHEDRPVVESQHLAMPSFSNSQRQPQPGRARITGYSHIGSTDFGPENLGGFVPSNSGLFGRGGTESFNRSRTSSAVSLPAISHTAEEFALDLNSPALSRPPVHSELFSTDSFVDNVVIPGLYSDGSAETSGVSAVFRESSSTVGLGGMPSATGLMGPQEIPGSGLNDMSMVGSMDSFENRIRTSSWVSSGCDMFGATTGLIECSGDDTLSGDLASILKLSGAEEKPDEVYDPQIERKQDYYTGYLR